MKLRSLQIWPATGILASLVALALLAGEHFLDHGKALLPFEHHWLSEYVLSASPIGQAMMRLAFVALGAAAASVAALSNGRTQTGLFAICATGLAAMALFDTDPNLPVHPEQWPTFHGLVHQGCLYVAMSAGLVAMALPSVRPGRNIVDLSLLGMAGLATAIQTVLVAESQGKMTLYGGITERIIVAATLLWVIRYCRACSVKDTIRQCPSSVVSGS
ncbi:MAG TPA: DUF998 domain-containing protein [Fimbriimonadaceae bacterium]|nr:DUF998 domain-containing protein [Fimbriimonadaceae bacterium]